MEERIEITRKYLAKRENLQLHLFLSCIALLICLSGLTLLYCYSKGKELFDTMHMETVGVVSVGLVIAFPGMVMHYKGPVVDTSNVTITMPQMPSLGGGLGGGGALGGNTGLGGLGANTGLGGNTGLGQAPATPPPP